MYKVMTIGPDGLIVDVELEEVPQLGSRITVNNKNYLVTEVHESVVPDFNCVCQLTWSK